jgi:hypothetical protein
MAVKKRWLSAREYARETGRTEGAIRQAGCRGQIKTRRVKGKVKYEYTVGGSGSGEGESLLDLKIRKLKADSSYREEQLVVTRRRNFEEWSEKFLEEYFNAFEPIRSYFQNLQDEKINGLFEACFKDLSNRLKNITE